MQDFIPTLLHHPSGNFRPVYHNPLHYSSVEYNMLHHPPAPLQPGNTPVLYTKSYFTHVHHMYMYIVHAHVSTCKQSPVQYISIFKILHYFSPVWPQTSRTSHVKPSSPAKDPLQSPAHWSMFSWESWVDFIAVMFSVYQWKCSMQGSNSQTAGDGRTLYEYTSAINTHNPHTTEGFQVL